MVGMADIAALAGRPVPVRIDDIPITTGRYDH
jgi:hypothetical protein